MSEQNYISKELIHFIGRGIDNQDSQYQLLLKILEDSLLMHPPFIKEVSGGFSVTKNGKFSDNSLYIPNAICFCDIPPDSLSIHIKKYSEFGISFLKDFIVKNGGRPVFYVPQKTILNEVVLEQYFDEIIKKYNINQFSFDNILFSSVDKLDLFHFFGFQIFGYMKFFDHNLPDDHPDNYYFEREWRIIGNLEFDFNNINSIYLPEKYFDKFKVNYPDLFARIVSSAL